MNKVTKGAPIFFNCFLRYKTSVLRCSPKKFHAIAYSLKNLTLDQAIKLSSVSQKYVCKSLCKDLYCVKANLLNVLNFSEFVVNQMKIGFVVTEPGKLKRVGTRFKARGRGSRSETSSCVACLYLKNNNIDNFYEFVQNNIKNNNKNKLKSEGFDNTEEITEKAIENNIIKTTENINSNTTDNVTNNTTENVNNNNNNNKT